MNVSNVAPAINLNLSAVADRGTQEAFRDTLRIMEELRRLLVLAINFNEISYIAQDAAPDVADGKTIIWKDTDAAAGDPVAYVLTKRAGATLTFASVEVV